MARVTFDESNKIQSATDFPKLKFELGERARIVCIEDPESEYVHRLEMPKVLDGKAVMVTKTRKDKTTYETYAMEWIGNPICLGDPGILADRGLDPQNCPACAKAQASDMVMPPKRRFAMHVMKYATKPGGFELATPFSIQTLVWSFTDKMFNKLVDYTKEWGSLQTHDLLVGPCTSKDFQTVDTAIAATAAWRDSTEHQQITVQTYKENQAPDLLVFCGRKTERKWIEEDLTRITERWHIVNGTAGANVALSTDTSASMETPSLAAGLEDLLTSQTGMDSAPAGPSFSDLMGSGSVVVPASQDTVVVQAEPEQKHDATAVTAALLAEPEPPKPPAEPNPKPGSSNETLSFEDLLKG